MANYEQAIETQVTAWNNVSAAPHQFNAREFVLRLNTRTIEIGHLHNGALLDILFSLKLRDALLAEGKTGIHCFIPESGWTSFYIQSQADYE